MPAAEVAPAKRERLVVTVDRPIPFEFDMGHLTAFDNNPLDAELYATAREECISAAIRDGAQALINQVLTALPLKSTKDGIFAELPAGVTPLPREKPIPRPKELTKWELFAKKKGVRAKPRDGKMVYDEEKQEWVPKWGYKGKNKEVEDQWLVEIDDTKKTAEGEEVNPRKLNREERKRNIKLNERQQKKNAMQGGRAPAAVLKPRKAGAGSIRKR